MLNNLILKPNSSLPTSFLGFKPKLVLQTIRKAFDEKV